jgi:CRISPR-associated protein Cas1
MRHRQVLGNDDSSWAERSAYWLKKSAPKSRRFMQRAGIRQPLILSGHSVRLRVDHGSLLVQDGFTHYPQERETWRFFPGEWRLPERIVVVDADGGITFDALAWLARHDVPLVQINWRGDVINVVGSSAKTSDPNLIRWQRSTQKKSAALRIAIEIIRKKFANSLETLRCVTHQPEVTDAIRKLKGELALFRNQPPSSISQLLSSEAKVAAAYFRALRMFPVRWKGLDRNPIPEDWHSFGRRASKAADQGHLNRYATHPIQAMLNYAYGILESQVRMQVVAAGLDPKVGIFHGSYKNKDGLVYDLMEPLRTLVDRAILRFTQLHSFRPTDFIIRPDGCCRLNNELARSVVGEVIRGLRVKKLLSLRAIEIV